MLITTLFPYGSLNTYILLRFKYIFIYFVLIAGDYARENMISFLVIYFLQQQIPPLFAEKFK